MAVLGSTVAQTVKPVKKTATFYTQSEKTHLIKLMVITRANQNRGEFLEKPMRTHVRSRFVLVLHLLGREHDAGFLDQSQNALKLDQWNIVIS